MNTSIPVHAPKMIASNSFRTLEAVFLHLQGGARLTRARSSHGPGSHIGHSAVGAGVSHAHPLST